MTAPALIKQEDVTRLMRGAREAGFTRVRLTIDPEGRIMVDAGDELGPIEEGPRNPLDRLFENGS